MTPLINRCWGSLDPETLKFVTIGEKGPVYTLTFQTLRTLTDLILERDISSCARNRLVALTISHVTVLQTLFSSPNHISRLHIDRYQLSDKEVVTAFAQVNTLGVRELALNSNTNFGLLLSAPNFKDLDRLVVSGRSLDSKFLNDLTSVKLKNLELDCELIKGSSRAFPRLFSHTSLESLHFRQTVAPNDESIEGIMEEFKKNTTLQKLELNETSPGFYKGMLNALSFNTTLTSFTYDTMKTVQELNVDEFSDVIACNTTLQSLCLVSSMLTITFPTLIKFTTESHLECMTLKMFSVVTYVNNPRFTPIEFVPDYMNPPNIISLTVCNLHGVKFSSKAAQLFLSLVSASPCLNEFSFIKCVDPSISHEVFPEFVNIVENNTCLTRLDITENSFKEPCYSKNLRSTLPYNSTLKTLNISDLTFEAPAGSEPDPLPFFERVFTVNTTLERLHIDVYPELTTERIASYLKNNASMLYLTFPLGRTRPAIPDVLERNRWNLRQRNQMLLNILLEVFNKSVLQSSSQPIKHEM